jgi:hypothetical protein
MGWAIIKVRDAQDGTVEFEAELSDPPDNNSLAHQVVVRFVESTDSQQANSVQANSIIAEKPQRAIIGLDGHRLADSK